MSEIVSGKRNMHVCKNEKRLNKSRRKVIFQIGLEVRVSATSTLPRQQPSSARRDVPPLHSECSDKCKRSHKKDIMWVCI